MSGQQLTQDQSILPHNTESEQQVIGGLLLLPPDRKTIIDDIAIILSSEDFYYSEHGKLWQAIIDIHRDGVEVDISLVRQKLKKMDMYDRSILCLVDILDKVVTSANIKRHAEIVRECSIRRKAIEQAYRVIDAAKNGYGINEEIENIQRIKDINYIDRPYQDISDATVNCIQQLEDLANNGSKGIQTGFYDLDRLITGLMPPDLIILAARPSMGKTSLACNIALNLGANGHNILFFSLETSIEQLTTKMLIQHGHIDSQKIRTGKLESRDWQNITNALASISDMKISIVDKSGLTPDDLSRISRKVKQDKGKMDLIIVDYLQLMRAGRRLESRNIEIGHISQGLKALAKDMKCPALALSQLSREVEKRNNKRPILADLRDSGSIEQDADVVMFIYRDEMYNADTDDLGIAEIRIEKHRTGPTGMIKLGFQKDCMCFSNLAT